MSTRGQTEFALWLMPDDLTKRRVQPVIQTLAKTYDAPSFDAHVTVYAGPSNDAEMKAIVAAVSGFLPVRLAAEKLNHTNAYTKTLFVQFGESENLRSMFESAKAAAEPRRSG